MRTEYGSSRGYTERSGPANLAIPLALLAPRQWALIARIAGEGALRRRLLDMGFIPGTAVYFRKTAPLGDPMELTLRGYDLSLRRADAAHIFVAPRPGQPLRRREADIV